MKVCFRHKCSNGEVFTELIYLGNESFKAALHQGKLTYFRSITLLGVFFRISEDFSLSQTSWVAARLLVVRKRVRFVHATALCNRKTD